MSIHRDDRQLSLFDAAPPPRPDAQPEAPVPPPQVLADGPGPFDLAPDQRAAVDLTSDRAISASAGTGKTHTLTALYVGLLEGRVAPGGKLLENADWLKLAGQKSACLLPHEIVAVTFTKKAAAELLERTREALASELKRADLPESLRQHLEACRAELASAPVCTIDAFCARLLREAGAAGPAPLQFTVFEQDEAGELLRRALSEVAAEFLERTPSVSPPFEGGEERERSFRTLAAQWGVYGTHGLIQIGAGLLAGLRTRGVDPATLKRAQKLSLSDMRQRLETVLAAIRQVPSAGRSKPNAEIRAFCEAVSLRDEQGVHCAALRLSELLHTSSGLYKWAEAAGIADPAPELLLDLHAPFATALADYLEQALARYAALKRQRGGVDFNDLLLFARELLRNDPHAASGYRLVLIDEYQDTNPLQCEVLKQVAAGPASAPVTAGPTAARLVVVGDRKQSIYRFRGADVRLMQEAERDWSVSPLRRNFRSRRQIVEFVNSFFGQLAPNFEYSAGDRLEADPNPARHAWNGPPGEAIAFKYAEGENANAELHRWHQAQAIARRIRCLTAGAQSLSRPPIWDKKLRRLRDTIEYGDIAVLARTLKHIRVPLQLALSQWNIPFRMLGGVTFYTRQEVLDVINLLASVADPQDNLAVAGLLRSPFVCLTDGAIWRLVFGDATQPARSLYRQLLEAAARPGQSDEAQAIQAAAALLQELGGGLGRRTAAELIDHACRATGYLNVLALQPQGEVAVAAVRRVIELSRGFEARGARHLSDFVAWLRERADQEWSEPAGEDKPDLSANLPENLQAVQIGTVHSAKGLEFPIVFLADIGAHGRFPNDPAVYSPASGLGLRLGVPMEGLDPVADSAHDAAVEAEKAADRQEYLRLLYVATTRAREYLIFTGNPGKHSQGTWADYLTDYRAGKVEPVLELVPSDHAALRAAKPAAQTALLKLEGRETVSGVVCGAPACPTPLTTMFVSVSKLALWLWCPRRAQFARIGETTQFVAAPNSEPGDEREPSDELAPEARALGTAAHAVLEAFFSRETDDLEAAWNHACAAEGIRARSAQAATTFKRLCAVARSPWAATVLNAPGERRFVEKPFRWRVVGPVSTAVKTGTEAGPTITLTGTLDLLYASGAHAWQLVDYKLCSSAALPEEFRARYAWQALIYAASAREILGESEQVEAALLFLADDTLQPAPMVAPANLALPGILRAFWQAASRAPAAQCWDVGAAAPRQRERALCAQHRCPFVATCFR